MNGVLMGLTTIFANQVKQSPWIIFDYMLRVGYTRNLNMQLSPTAFDQMLSFTGIMQDMSIKNIVLLMTAVGKANNLKLPELIPLEGFAFKSKKSLEVKRNAIDNILKEDDINTAQKVLALLPLFSLKGGQSQNTGLYYSVLPLLSAICMIIRSGYDELSIKGILSDLSLHRTYPMPSEGQVISGTAEDNIYSTEELSQKLDINIEDESVEGLVKALIDWRKSFIHDNENSPIPPYLLGRIMTRFTSALENISLKNNLAEQVQLQLVSFLNSVLVEETKDLFGNKVNINNNNLRSSVDLFCKNLNIIKWDEECWRSLRLIRWLIDCPLIICFIKKSLLDRISMNHLSVYNYLQKNISKHISSSDFSIYEILSDIKIKSDIRHLSDNIMRTR